MATTVTIIVIVKRLVLRTYCFIGILTSFLYMRFSILLYSSVMASELLIYIVTFKDLELNICLTSVLRNRSVAMKAGML